MSYHSHSSSSSLPRNIYPSPFHMQMSDLTYINASCHCALNIFRVGFRSNTLPISTELCHCSTCRHVSGQLAMEHVSIVGVPLMRVRGSSRSHSRSRTPIQSRTHSRSRTPLQSRSPSRTSVPNGYESDHSISMLASLLAPPPRIIIDPDEPDIPLDLGDLTPYKTSPDVTRYFCKSCSSHLFWVHHTTITTTSSTSSSPESDGMETTTKTEDQWAVAVGALDETEGVVKLGRHIWVGDTLDGGLADHLRFMDGIELPRYKEAKGSEILPIGWKAPFLSQGPSDAAAAAEQLRAHCHCGTISFLITRPTSTSAHPSAAYPDLICPYDVSLLSKITNPRDEKWWLAPRGSLVKTKYLAGHCMCDFCRLSSGFEVQSWAFVPLVNIVRPGGTTKAPLRLQERDKEDGRRPKGLKQYISSPGRYREFCGTCGATVFWWQAGVPDLVDVSVGLFDEQSVGARAESWLEWVKSRVSFQEKALNTTTAKALSEGLKMIQS